MLNKLDGPFKLPANNKPEKLFIFLHGLGANGFDLIDLSYDFEDLYTNAAFLSPNAPFPHEIYSGYQWFGLNDYDQDKIYNGIKIAMPYLEEYITRNLNNFKLGFKDLILLGFSQGSMMAIQYALRQKESLQAVICYSGAIIKPDLLKTEIKSKQTLFIAHGLNDQVIPIAKHHQTISHLKEFKVNFTEFVDPSLAHSISQDTVSHTREFLKNLNR